LAGSDGQEVKADETLVVIEVMKMENILKPAQDCKVQNRVAKADESLSVDRAIIESEGRSALVLFEIQ
jgi:biotin carboxyl carrier protein